LSASRNGPKACDDGIGWVDIMNRKFTIRAGIGIFILFFLIGILLLTKEPETPWKPTTVAYDPGCKKGCEELSSTSLTHLGDISIYVQPNVDDAIAQWGDCLDSVTQCVEDKDLTRVNIAACVKESICPNACKVAFATEVRGANQVAEALDAFEQVFINDNTVCLPKEGNR